MFSPQFHRCPYIATEGLTVPLVRTTKAASRESKLACQVIRVFKVILSVQESPGAALQLAGQQHARAKKRVFLKKNSRPAASLPRLVPSEGCDRCLPGLHRHVG